MAEVAKPFTFGHHLRRTTRNAIFLPPLFWNTNHLDLFRVSLAHPVHSEHQPPNRLQHTGPILDTASIRTKRLPTGSIDQECLRNYWSWAKYGDDMAADWLPQIITMIVDSIQKDLGEKVFVKHVKEYGMPPPILEFKFTNTTTGLQPELLLRTSKTNIPFFIFSTAAHRFSLRDDLADVFRRTSQSWRILREAALTDFEIDPFDVSCLIAMAQEQATRFKSSYLPEIPTHFTVYLMTPNPHTSSSLYLFTASIPRDYLDAMEDLDLEVRDNLVITREAVEVPAQYDKLNEGGLVERLGEVLEGAFAYHDAMKILLDEKEVHDRQCAIVRSIKSHRRKLLVSGAQPKSQVDIVLPLGARGLARSRVGGV